jgi:hypothetical protein
VLPRSPYWLTVDPPHGVELTHQLEQNFCSMKRIQVQNVRSNVNAGALLTSSTSRHLRAQLLAHERHALRARGGRFKHEFVLNRARERDA